jgi:hypothetical protein
MALVSADYYYVWVEQNETDLDLCGVSAGCYVNASFDHNLSD